MKKKHNQLCRNVQHRMEQKKQTKPINIYNFTIVELLVVISIIIILAGLLMPTLNKARDKAKSINCVVNLKQIGIAIQTYTVDFDGYYPAKCTSQLTATSSSRKLITIMLSNYIPATSMVYHCPDEYEGLFKTEKTSYMWNWGQIEYPGNEKSGKSSYNAAPFGMSTPSKFPLIADASPYHGKGKKGINVLYADSRVDDGESLPF